MYLLLVTTSPSCRARPLGEVPVAERYSDISLKTGPSRRFGTNFGFRVDFREALPYADQCACRSMHTQIAAELLPRLRRQFIPTRAPSATVAEALPGPRFRTQGLVQVAIAPTSSAGTIVPFVFKLAARLG